MKKGKIVLSLIGSLLCLLWLVPFYLMIVNSFKTKKRNICFADKYAEKFKFYKLYSSSE